MIYALFTVITVLQIADAWTTLRVLAQPGGYETNVRLARWFAKYGALRVLVVVKTAVVAILAAQLWLIDWALASFPGVWEITAGCWVALAAVAALAVSYARVVRNNWRLIRR